MVCRYTVYVETPMPFRNTTFTTFIASGNGDYRAAHLACKHGLGHERNALGSESTVLSPFKPPHFMCFYTSKETNLGFSGQVYQLIFFLHLTDSLLAAI